MSEKMTPEQWADLLMWEGFKLRAVIHMREAMAQAWEEGRTALIEEVHADQVHFLAGFGAGPRPQPTTNPYDSPPPTTTTV